MSHLQVQVAGIDSRRNARIGLTLEDALGKMHMVAEGVRAARMFLSRAAIQGTLLHSYMHCVISRWSNLGR